MNAGTTKARQTDITTVEFLNSLFITTILYLHHSMYTAYHIKLLPEWDLNLYLQKLAVGGFFFLSGLKMTQSKSETSFTSFISNRFFRIYVLYVMAVISYSIIVFPYLNWGRFPDLKNVIVHALGIQSVIPGLFGKGYLTLWFISFLFLCYAFFLISRKTVQNSLKFLTVLGISILFITAVHYLGKQIGMAIFRPDISIFLVYFGLGMLFAVNRQTFERINRFLLLLLIVVGLVGALYFLSHKSQIKLQGFVTFLFYLTSHMAFYLLMFKKLSTYQPSKQMKALLKYTSYASFCVFLFHRPVWSVMNLVWFKTSLLHALYIIVFSPICIFIGCHRLQTEYDKLVKKI